MAATLVESDLVRDTRQRGEVAREVMVGDLEIQNFNPETDMLIPGMLGCMTTSKFISDFTNTGEERHQMSGRERVDHWLETNGAALTEMHRLVPGSLRFEFYEDPQTMETGKVLVGTPMEGTSLI